MSKVRTIVLLSSMAAVLGVVVWMAVTGCSSGGAVGSVSDTRVPDAIRDLSDVSSIRRMNAARTLGGMKDRRVVEALIRALTDSSHEVRYAAVNALDEIGDLRAVDPLIAVLKDKDANIRSEAARALGKMHDTRAVMPLIDALKDEDHTVEEAAITALGRLKDTRAAEPLISIIREGGLSTGDAVYALAELNDPRSKQMMMDVLSDPEGGAEQEAAAQTLCRFGDSGTVDFLIRLFKAKDGSPNRRLYIAKALAGMGQAAPEGLVALLNDSDPGLRISTAEALAGFHDPASAEALAAGLKDRDHRIRVSCARSMCKRGDARGVDALAALQHDADQVVRTAAVLELAEKGDARAVAPLIRVLKDGRLDFEAYYESIRLLGSYRDVRAITFLLSLPTDTDGELRDTVAHTLKKIGTPASEAVTAALRSPDSTKRANAAYTVGLLKDRNAVKGLISLLKDPVPDVRSCAAKSLGEMRDQSALLPLAKALHDSDERVRDSAVRSLGSMKDPRAMDSIISAINDPSPRVRVAAVETFARLKCGNPKAIQPLIGVFLLDRKHEAVMGMPGYRTDCYMYAEDALVNIGPASAKPLSGLLLKVPDRYAAEALARIEPESVERLASALKDRDVNTRRNAATALGWMADPRSIPALTAATKDKNPGVRKAASLAIRRIRDDN